MRRISFLELAALAGLFYSIFAIYQPNLNLNGYLLTDQTLAYKGDHSAEHAWVRFRMPNDEVKDFFIPRKAEFLTALHDLKEADAYGEVSRETNFKLKVAKGSNILSEVSPALNDAPSNRFRNVWEWLRGWWFLGFFFAVQEMRGRKVVALGDFTQLFFEAFIMPFVAVSRLNESSQISNIVIASKLEPRPPASPRAKLTKELNSHGY